jgi:hypothetical protein
MEMILRVGWRALVAFVILAPVMAQAGDGTFGIPPSGILVPPSPRQTASLIPPERADPERARPLRRMQQTFSPAPADGAGRSRVVPPSEAPVHSPIVVPPKKKQFKAPVASVGRVRGLPGVRRRGAAASPIASQPEAAPQRSRLSFLGARPSARAKDGTPCGQLRGIFT